MEAVFTTCVLLMFLAFYVIYHHQIKKEISDPVSSQYTRLRMKYRVVGSVLALFLAVVYFLPNANSENIPVFAAVMIMLFSLSASEYFLVTRRIKKNPEIMGAKKYTAVKIFYMVLIAIEILIISLMLAYL